MHHDDAAQAMEELSWPARLTPLADWLLRASTMALPEGRSRTRYRQEFRAELAQMQPRQQVVYALRVLRRSWSLRQAVSAGPRPNPVEAAVPDQTTHKPLLCLLNVHHHWDWQRTGDGQRYRRCRSCGKDDDGLLNSRRQNGAYIMGIGPSQ